MPISPDVYKKIVTAKGVVFKSEPKEQFYGIEAVVTDGLGNWFSMTQPSPRKPMN